MRRSRREEPDDRVRLYRDWCNDKLADYQTWRDRQSRERQTQLDILLRDLQEFYWYPPWPGGAFGAEQPNERFNPTVKDLGHRLRALSKDAIKPALAVYALPDPGKPTVDVWDLALAHPDPEEYIRFLWTELVRHKAISPDLIRMPLEYLLRPNYTVSRICRPGESIREHLDIALTGVIRRPLPFNVVCDVLWEIEDTGHTVQEQFLVVSDGGSGAGPRESVKAPSLVGDYSLSPVLHYVARGERSDAVVKGALRLPEMLLTVTSDPDEAVERVRYDPKVCKVTTIVRWVRGSAESDGTLRLSTELRFSCHLPATNTAPLFLIPEVLLESGKRFDLHAVSVQDLRALRSGTFWSFASSQRIKGANLPAPGEHQAKLRFRPDPTGARHAGYNRLVDFGPLLTDSFTLKINASHNK